MTTISQHIINAKKLLGDIELLTACPTNTDLAKFEEKLIELDQETSQIWILLDELYLKDYREEFENE